MKIITGISVLIMLIFTPVVPAQDEPAPGESPPGAEFYGGPGRGPGSGEGGSDPSERRFHGRQPGSMKGSRRMQFKQFRREVKALGYEIRENELTIQSLEEELETIEPGVARAEVRKTLNQTRLRQAELQLELARKRVDFTRRARDLAQERYDEARLALASVNQKIMKDYPDLASELAPEMTPTGPAGLKPDF